jgi:ABC-type nitrate/sulfonate/bicarbonate transport system substrate-binding protein
MQSYHRVFITVALFALSLAPSALPIEGATLMPLRIGYPSPSASFFPLFATKEAGLFEKYGFDPEMIYVQGVQLVQVHVSGQLDVASISSVVYLQASIEGADLVQIASSIDNQLMRLMVEQDHRSNALRLAHGPARPAGSQKLGAGPSEGCEADSDRQNVGYRIGHCIEASGRRRHFFSDLRSSRQDGH